MTTLHLHLQPKELPIHGSNIHSSIYYIYVELLLDVEREYDYRQENHSLKTQDVNQVRSTVPAKSLKFP
jgi:hypothetical protein